MPDERCGVSGTTSCWEVRVRLDGVGVSEEACDDGRLEGVWDIFTILICFQLIIKYCTKIINKQ